MVPLSLDVMVPRMYCKYHGYDSDHPTRLCPDNPKNKNSDQELVDNATKPILKNDLASGVVPKHLAIPHLDESCPYKEDAEKWRKQQLSKKEYMRKKRERRNEKSIFKR